MHYFTGQYVACITVFNNNGDSKLHVGHLIITGIHLKTCSQWRLVADFGDNLSLKTATVAENGPQCGQGFTIQYISCPGIVTVISSRYSVLH